MVDKIKKRKRLIKAAKIAIGSSAAICIAQTLHLDYATSAGTIALLTVVTTKWETIRLSFFRLVTLLLTIMLAGVLFWHINNEWVSYGMFIFILVMICEMFGWAATISVNSVIGAHFLTEMNFSIRFIANEIMLVVIGITIAVILNLFYANESSKKKLVSWMRLSENQLQIILGEIAAYLSNKEMQRNVWEDICTLEKQLQEFIKEAYEYQENTFQSHPGYYIAYFEMRLNQCQVLHNLHYEMKKMRTMPKQEKIIAEYMIYLMDYVVELNVPASQIEKLNEIFLCMKQEQLPTTRDEFESRALLYHILMDLEEFLVFKQRFVNALNEKQRKVYWRQ